MIHAYLAITCIFVVNLSSLSEAKGVISEASRYTVKVNSAVKYPFGRDNKGTAKIVNYLNFNS
jgi:hypothetical protein